MLPALVRIKIDSPNRRYNPYGRVFVVISWSHSPLPLQWREE